MNLGFAINQMVTNWTMVPYLLYWDFRSQKWVFLWLQNKSKLRAYFISLIFIICLLLPLCYFILMESLLNPGLLSLSQIIPAVVAIQLINLCIVVDISLYTNGRDFVSALAWFHKFEQKLDRLAGNLHKSTVKAELLKILKAKSDQDRIGLTVLQVAITYPLIAIVVPICGIYFQRDPLFVAYVAWTGDSIDNVYFLVIRIVFTLVCAQVVITNQKTITLAITDVCVAGLNCVVKCSKLGKKFSLSSVKLYKELYLCILELEAFSKPLLIVYLSVIFVTLVAGTSLSIMSIRAGRFLNASFAGFVTNVTFWLAVFVLYCGSMAYEITTKLLSKTWKHDVLVNGGAYYKRVHKSIFPIAIKVGDVGILDKEIKMNYMNAVNIYVANVLIGAWELLHGQGHVRM